MGIVAMVIVIRNSYHALNSAHHATDRTADDSTSRGTDRTGRAVAYGRAARASTHNALGLRRERHRKSGNNDDGSGELRLH